MYFVGIDLGTSAVKILLMDSQGQIISAVSRDYPICYARPGWSEQNPYDWYDRTIDGLKELLEGVDKSLVAGISFGGQMHGLVMLDEKDEVIRPAILWNDSRTTKECDYLNNVIGKDKLSECTANIAFAGFTAPKIMWVKANEPDNYARIHRIMLPKDYLVYRMTGVHATDVSDASGMLLFDVKNRCWSEEMLKICGVKREWLADIYESYEAVGSVTKALAEELGIGSECVVAAGAGDNAAAAVGTGTVGNGECNISIGTSGTVFITSDKFGVDKNNALHSFAHADGAYHLMGCILAAASCNKWWMEDILGTEDFQKEQADISRLGRNDVYFLPYLSGERSPHNNPLAKGAFIGMTMSTGRRDMTQAVLEGVAFALRDCIEVARSLGIEVNTSKICGGGAKSRLWQRIIANVCNLELQVPNVSEGPAMGAAILAAVAAGKYKDVKEAAAKIVGVTETVKPEEELVELYNARYECYRKMYPACVPVYEMISR